MATFYWVGGNGDWDATTTTNWASSSGGAGGAGVPTSTDDVVFDANSSGGADFAVTITGDSTAPALCQDFTASSLSHVMTLTFSDGGFLDCRGSMTVPASNFSVALLGAAFTGYIVFSATTTGKTITTNGVDLGSINWYFNGVGGGWSLGSAITSNTLVTEFFNGSFDTANYNLTINSVRSGVSSLFTYGTRSISFGSSNISLGGGAQSIGFVNTTDLTFNAGTSTITCSAATPTFNGGGQTFYNVTFSSVSNGTVSINGDNTFNDLIFTSTNFAQRTLTIGGNQTVSGTLTFGTGNTNIRKMQVGSSVNGTQRTITANGTLSSLNDVSFRDIAAAGTVSTPWTGTRIGSGGNLSNITADAPKTVYRTGTGTWSQNFWATTSGGTPNLDNFPLPQDAIIFDNNTTSGTHTMNAPWWLGSLDCSAVTSAITIANGAQSPQWHGDMTLDSDITLTATGGQWLFVKPAASGTQIITPAGVTFAPALNFASPGTIQFAANITTDRGVTLSIGTLDLNDFDLTCLAFISTNANTRSIDFGTSSEINVTGNDAVVWSTANANNLSITGTPVANFTYSGSTGSRNIQGSEPAQGGTESNAFNFNVTNGTDTVLMGAFDRQCKNLNFTGFSGTFSNNGRIIFGDLTISSGMTLSAGGAVTQFAATSGTQQVTTAGKTFDFPVTVNAPGATVQLQDALTMGSTRTLTLTEGTLELKDGVTSTVGDFVTTGSSQKFLQSTASGTQATISKASGTVSVSNLTIKDSNATGGATWNSFVRENNIDNGNNDGWIFQSGNMFLIFT